MPASALRLSRVGRPLPIDDGERRFLVHPFLFRLCADAPPVTLNWENIGHKWVAPAEVGALPAVPQLVETLDRLLLPPHLQASARALAGDIATVSVVFGILRVPASACTWRAFMTC